MIEPESFTVTKASAARSQLETSISLWFNNADPISIHALAAAANELLNAIGARAGKPSEIQPYIKSRPPAIRDRLRKAQNFFKHAGRDLNERFEYHPMHGEVLITDSILIYHALAGEMTPLMAAFTARLSVTEPDLASFLSGIMSQETAKNLAMVGRPQFLKAFLGGSIKPH